MLRKQLTLDQNLSLHHSITSGSITGVMINSDPASIAFSASSMVRMVPQPIIFSPSYFSRKLAKCSKQSGVVKVNSHILKPPSIAACIALGQASEVDVRRTAHARCVANLFKTSSYFSIENARSSDDDAAAVEKLDLGTSVFVDDDTNLERTVRSAVMIDLWKIEQSKKKSGGGEKNEI